jgi:hypothetical protein
MNVHSDTGSVSRSAHSRTVRATADDGYVRCIEQSSRSVLPLKAAETALITPSSLGRLADTPRQKAETHGPWRDLRTTRRWTRREQQIALMAAAGHSDAAIAAALKNSARTVQTHLARLYRKLAVSGRHKLPDALSQGQGRRSLRTGAPLARDDRPGQGYLASRGGGHAGNDAADRPPAEERQSGAASGPGERVGGVGEARNGLDA